MSNEDKVGMVIDKIELITNKLDKLTPADKQEEMTESMCGILLPLFEDGLAKLEKFLEDNC